MIRFTVVWHDDAQNLLAELWLGAADRSAITKAADAMDAFLATDAPEKGTLVEGELREVTVAPLRILFAVSEPDRLVKIVHVELL